MADNPLGLSVDFPQQYAPQVLVPIARQVNRAVLGMEDTALPFQGADIWNAYELSWLNSRGKPQVATGRFIFPCDSPNLVESKSLKLYLGSFNQEACANEQQLAETLCADLSRAAGAQVQVALHGVGESRQHLPEPPAGTCLDELEVDMSVYETDPGLLQWGEDLMMEEVLYTDLFRSLCPITAQPDWATVTVCYRGRQISHASLLRYLVSYRQHNDYHENCVERIFMDLMQYCEPQSLTVEANFLRRGGLDINPVRSSADIGNYEHFPRYLRQ